MRDVVPEAMLAGYSKLDNTQPRRNLRRQGMSHVKSKWRIYSGQIYASL